MTANDALAFGIVGVLFVLALASLALAIRDRIERRRRFRALWKEFDALDRELDAEYAMRRSLR